MEIFSKNVTDVTKENGTSVMVRGQLITLDSLRSLNSFKEVEKGFTEITLVVEPFAEGVQTAFLQNAIGTLTAPVNSQEFSLANGLDVDSLLKMTQSYALIVKRSNYSANTQAQMNNAIEFVRKNINLQEANQIVSTGMSKNAINPNEELLTLDYATIFDFSTGIKVQRANATTNLSLTLSILGMVAYKDLQS
jgi:hypothetical protein